MNWIEKINNEFEKKSEADSNVNEQLESVIDDFLKLAESEAIRVNDETNQENINHKFNCHVYRNNSLNEFYVQADSASNNKIVRMTVSFIPNNQKNENSTTNNFIRVEREIDDKQLKEIIAVRFDRARKEITFEPRIFDGATNTDNIKSTVLARLLVEPVIRKFLGLPQVDYKERFGG